MARSISKLLAHASVAVMAPVAIACLVPACSSDEPAAVAPGDDGGGAMGNTGGGKNTGGKPSTGGSSATGGKPAATGGTAGAGGSTGGSSGSGGATGGTAGAGGATGGSPGTGGSTGGTPATGGAPAGGAGGTDGGDGGDGGNCSPLPLTPPSVTAKIQVPAGATAVHHFHAVGTQNYTCKGTPLPDAGTSYSWGASVPEADLFQGTCKVGTHYAGPSWAFTDDGSVVKGAKVDAETHAGTIPWLLLKAVDHTGTGVFSNVTFIQRVDTTGGVSPSDQCDATHNLNEVKKIPYTAEYYFFEGGVGDAGP